MTDFEQRLIATIRDESARYATDRDGRLCNVLCDAWEQRGLAGMAELIVAMAEWSDRFERRTNANY